MSSSNHVLLNDSYNIPLMHKVKFGQNNFTPFENNIHNITIPTITQFNKSKELENLDFNQNLYNKAQSIVNVENILILSMAILISSIVTLSILVIYTKVKKWLSTKKYYNNNVKRNSDMNSFENRKKVIYKDRDVLDIDLYLNDLKQCI